ncbi:unnamed protein product [Rhodiola kirilowii]
MPRSTVSCWSYQNASFATLLNIMTILPLRHKLFTAARTANRPARSRVGQQEKWRMKRLRSLTSFYSGFSIKYCDSDKGFGIYTSADVPEDGVLLVVPLDLAITPMRWSACLQSLHGSRRYLDMLPTTFGNPLWFTDGEVEELKGTALYRASKLQVSMLSLNDGNHVRNGFDDAVRIEIEETVWVEGLVPGIDFCNHSLRPGATWEVDRKGSITGIPVAMYVLSAEQNPIQIEKEITISYGDKGNEELLYLYGFVIDNNPADYLMIHYPVESLQSIPYADAKSELLQAQVRLSFDVRSVMQDYLHSYSLLETSQNDCNSKAAKVGSYSWSGKRKMPSYLSKLVFPEDFLTALRTISMKEEQLYQVSSMLEEVRDY